MDTVPRLARSLRRPHSSSGNALVASVRSLSAALAVVLSASAGFAQSGAIRSDAIAGVLPALGQAQVAASIGQDDTAYHALAQPQGFSVDNSGHDLSAAFTSAGVDFHRGPNHWRMSLRGYGYGDMLRDVGAVDPEAAANRVEYRRGALTEWYVNGPLGLEQGFTLERAPSRSNGQPLT